MYSIEIGREDVNSAGGLKWAYVDKSKSNEAPVFNGRTIAWTDITGTEKMYVLTTLNAKVYSS